MSWAKIDDRANEHRKQVAAGADACWLWTCGLMYVNRQDARDGFIPDGVLGMLYPFKSARKLAAKLVDVGLWDKVDDGYQVHNFEKWNKSREQIDDERAATRNRVAAHRAKKACNAVTPPGSNGAGNDECNAVSTGSSASADSSASASAEDPDSLSGNASARDGAPKSAASRCEATFASKCPDELEITPTIRDLCEKRGLDPADEIAKLQAWARANRRTALDWNAELELWIRRSKVIPPEQRGQPQPRSGPLRSGFETPAERRTREQLDRVAMLERQEREAQQ